MRGLSEAFLTVAKGCNWGSCPIANNNLHMNLYPCQEHCDLQSSFIPRNNVLWNPFSSGDFLWCCVITHVIKKGFCGESHLCLVAFQLHLTSSLSNRTSVKCFSEFVFCRKLPVVSRFCCWSPCRFYAQLSFWLDSLFFITQLFIPCKWERVEIGKFVLSDSKSTI